MADQTFAVTAEVPHSGRAAWHWVADQFAAELAAQVIPPVLAADLVSEIRRGRDGLRLRIAVSGLSVSAPTTRPAWARTETRRHSLQGASVSRIRADAGEVGAPRPSRRTDAFVPR